MQKDIEREIWRRESENIMCVMYVCVRVKTKVVTNSSKDTKDCGRDTLKQKENTMDRRNKPAQQKPNYRQNFFISI